MGSRHSGNKAKREYSELLLLYEISRILDASLDLHDVMEPVLNELCERTDMVHATVALLNRETGEINIEAAHGLSAREQQKGRYALGEGVTGRVVETGQPAIVPAVSDEAEFLDRTGVRKGVGDDDQRGFVCVPVTMGKEVIGTLSADVPRGTAAVLREDLRLLTIVASMIAQAVRLRRAMQEEREHLLEENLRLQGALSSRFSPTNIVGNSKSMQAVYDLIHQVSRSDTTVLLRGESGVGKELVAQAIHYNSARAAKPFVKVNCAALPDNLLQSELFGHERGAFSGAVAQRQGRFELADKGTIFLDEIGDVSPATQIALLRVLQEREFERVGGTKTLRADVRIIAATNRDLDAGVSAGAFRDDLFWRLNVFPIRVPPLRSRKTDILLLADHFIERYAHSAGKTVRRISTPAIDMLHAYHWPGNVRELENCIERAVLLTSDDVIRGHHLPPSLQTAEASGTRSEGTLAEALERLEKELVQDALKSSRGNMAKAARQLGITERIMGLRVGSHSIDARRFKSRRKPTLM